MYTYTTCMRKSQLYIIFKFQDKKQQEFDYNENSEYWGLVVTNIF